MKHKALTRSEKIDIVSKMTDIIPEGISNKDAEEILRLFTFSIKVGMGDIRIDAALTACGEEQ